MSYSFSYKKLSVELLVSWRVFGVYFFLYFWSKDQLSGPLRKMLIARMRRPRSRMPMSL